MSAEHSDLNSDDNHNFYNDIDNSNDDDDDGNINDSYNNDEYHYPSELGQIIRISAFVCLLQEEFRISLISSWLYCLILEKKSHMSSELVSECPGVTYCLFRSISVVLYSHRVLS